MEINATIPVQYNKPNIEYQQTTVRSVIKVSNDTQMETVYTYDKYGRLLDTVVRKHDIGSV